MGAGLSAPSVMGDLVPRSFSGIQGKRGHKGIVRNAVTTPQCRRWNVFSEVPKRYAVLAQHSAWARDVAQVARRLIGTSHAEMAKGPSPFHLFYLLR